MSGETLTLYKLIILTMLDLVEFPLSNSQISEFIVEKEYTNYFNVQEALNELEESQLVLSENKRNNTFYTLTEEGKTTLELFGYKISRSIEEDIFSYFSENEVNLKNPYEIYAEYYLSPQGEYLVDCVMKEKGSTIVNLTIKVPDEKRAGRVCDYWNENCSRIYNILLERMSKGSNDK